METKIAEHNEVYDECESSASNYEYIAIALKKNYIGSISSSINLNHTIGIPIYQLQNKLWTSLSLTQ